MINLERLISNTPMPVKGDIYFYQPTMGQIMDMSEGVFWGLLKIWNLDRKELIREENEETRKYNDYNLWVLSILSNQILRDRLAESVDCFLHTKVEFLDISHTIVIGEIGKGILLDQEFYDRMKAIASSLFDTISGTHKDEQQYQENDKMSDREREMIRKMKASAEKLDKIKNGDKEAGNYLIKQVVSLVAIGHYTFQEVFDMTMVQMIYLLRKFVDIESYEIRTMLSPYMDSKKTEPAKHWINT